MKIKGSDMGIRKWFNLVGIGLVLTIVSSLLFAQKYDEFVGAYLYGKGPEIVEVTKIGDHLYRLEVINPHTGVSRWEMVGYYKDGYFASAYINKPGSALMMGVWRGRMVRPGVLRVESTAVPPDKDANMVPWSWSSTLTKIR